MAKSSQKPAPQYRLTRRFSLRQRTPNLSAGKGQYLPRFGNTEFHDSLEGSNFATVKPVYKYTLGD